MKDLSCYKDFNDDFLSSRFLYFARDLKSDFDDVSEDECLIMIEKIKQLKDIKDADQAQGIIDTITDLIEKNSKMARVLIKNDFQSLFTYLIEIDTNTFYCSLYDLLSEIILKYDGNLTDFVTKDMLHFLNILSDENSHIFISNLKCLQHLLYKDASFKHFFIQNGGYHKLLNYTIYKDMLEDKIQFIFNILSRIIEIPETSDLSDEYINSIEEQKSLFSQILKSLENDSYIEGKTRTLICLDYFIRTSLNLEPIIGRDQLIIFDKQIFEQIINVIFKNVRLNNNNIVYICLDMIYIFLKAKLYTELIDIQIIQQNILLIFNVFKDSYSPILYSFKILTVLANNITTNEMISDDIICESIEFSKSKAFAIKSQAVHFLSVLIINVDSSHAVPILNKYPVIIEIFCDFLHTKDSILQDVLSALGRSVELSQNDQLAIGISEIFQWLDIDYLNELLVNYEHEKNEDYRYLIITSEIRLLIKEYNRLNEE